MQHEDVLLTASHIHLQDLLGLGRLAIDGTVRVTDLAETVHRNITGSPRDAGSGIPELVYNSVRAIAGLVGGGMDALLPSLVPTLGASASTPQREAWLAVLNGVLGDYLAATNNPLAIAERFIRRFWNTASWRSVAPRTWHTLVRWPTTCTTCRISSRVWSTRACMTFTGVSSVPASSGR